MERYLQIAERVIALIRPKFYNRLTWIVVLAGLLLMSSPWWLDIVNAFAVRYLGFSLPPSDPHFGWGMALVVSGMAYHIAVHYINELIATQSAHTTHASHQEHDRKTFDSFAAVLSEDDLAWILSDIQNQHAYVSTQGSKLDNAARHLLSPATQFIDTHVSAAARDFGLSLRELRNWLSLNFFAYGPTVNNEHRFCLYPELNEDRSSKFPSLEESRRYEAFAKDMYAKIDDAESKYVSFRSSVKMVLAV